MESMFEVSDIPYLNGTRRLVLRPGLSLDDLLIHPQCPVFLHGALCGKVTWQKRSEFSIVHVLGVPSLAPQFVGTLLAWGTGCVLGDGSERPLSELLDEPGAHNRIRSLLLPLDVPGRVWADARTGSSPADFPIVWALAVLDLQEGLVQNARIALGGTWEQSVKLTKSAEKLAGQPLNEAVIQQTADAVMEETTPRDDYRGSVEYRKAMAGVMTRRALQACLEGAAA